MQVSDAHLLPAAAKKAMVLESLLNLVIVGVITGVIYAVLTAFQLPALVILIARAIAALVIIALIVNLIASITVKYQRYRYIIHSDLIAVRSGVFTITREYLPMRRLQKVHVESGLINRFCGLADIELYSAGGTLSIRYLPADEAEALAEDLNNKVNELIADGEVLTRV
ncbi:PH domain-containing protein [Peptococcus simiae]|uniref:PH domain-containing protein n=1 Tax=Peptococcus simiae TaxID=1643805 RepID=A0ABW9H0G4_9FIRM